MNKIMSTFARAENSVRKTKHSWLFVLVVAWLASATVHSQERSQAAAIDEVIVTATYRDTALLDTPISISTMDENVLTAKGAVNLQTLYQSIPGLSYRTGSSTFNTISVRGLTAPGGGGSVVGVYIDDIPVTDSNDATSQPTGTLYDVKRVEVLKGPQGTLYGEGNMGGALRYITHDADPNRFDANIRAQLSDHSKSDDLSWKVNGMVNVPLLEDTFALRLSGQYRDRAGFIDTGPPRSEDDVNFIEETALRGKFAWHVSDTLSLNATINYIDGDYGGPTNANLPYATSELTNTAWEERFVNGANDENWQYNLSVNWDLPWASFLSSSSYYERDIEFAEQTSPRFRDQIEGGLIPLLRLPEFAPGVPNPFFVPGFPTTGAAIAAAGATGTLRRRAHRFIQEFRLVSATAGPWQWTTGFYYKDDTAINGDEDRPSFGLTLNTGFEPFRESIEVFFAGSEDEFITKEAALYGEVSYDLTEQWNVLLGLRYSRNERELVGSDFPDVEDNLVSPKLTVTFRPVEDHMLYVTYAQGFRPGVINQELRPAIDGLVPFQEVPGVQEDIDFMTSRVVVEGDEVFNLELGYKASFFDGRLKGSAAIYYMDWKDVLLNQRIATLVNPTGVNYDDNSGDAHSQGIELEFDVLLTENLTFHFGGDYNQEAEIESFSDGQFVDIMGNPIAILPGNRLANSPKSSFNMSLDYGFSVGANEGFARADWYRVASSFNRATNEQTTAGYHTVNGRVGLTAASGKWSVSLFGTNLNNDQIRFETNEVGTSFGAARTFGLAFQWNLNSR